VTSPYVAIDATNLMDEEEEEEDEEVLLSPEELEAFLEEIDGDTLTDHADTVPKSLDLCHIQCHSSNRAGHEHITNGGNIP